MLCYIMINRFVKTNSHELSSDDSLGVLFGNEE
jgi:hypothetical protein